MMLVLAALFFCAFGCDVIAGAIYGKSFLSDTQQALILFVAAVAFVGAILQHENNANKTDDAQ